MTVTVTMQTTPRYRLYRWYELAPLFVLAVLGLALRGDFAGWCLLLAWGYAVARDLRGAISLRGRIPWRRLPFLLRLPAVAAYIILYPLLFIAYVVLAALDTWQWQRTAPERTRRRIAELERELKIGQPGK